MPLQIAKAVAKAPHSLLHRLRREVSDINCLPGGKNLGKVGAEDVVKCLAGDVGLLCSQVDCCHSIDEIQQPKAIEVIQQVSCDVQKQLHTVLHVIRVITADRGEGNVCPKHTLLEACELLENFLGQDLPRQLLEDLPILQFEARKDVMNMCCALLWPGMPQKLEAHVLQYFRSEHVFSVLVKGYANEEVALQYGVVLRSCARHAELVEAFLKTRLVFDLVQVHARSSSIDVSSDAMYSLREVLLECKEVSAAWLGAHFQEFFGAFNRLLESEEYLLQRQCLTLLSTMLLDRAFKPVMLKYVGDAEYLKVIMNLLLEPSRVLRYDAFQVFKVFAANPQKPRKVQLILFKNKEGLARLLDGIQAPHADDERFGNERRTIVERLRNLEAPPGSCSSPAQIPRGVNPQLLHEP